MNPFNWPGNYQLHIKFDTGDILTYNSKIVVSPETAVWSWSNDLLHVVLILLLNQTIGVVIAIWSLGKLSSIEESYKKKCSWNSIYYFQDFCLCILGEFLETFHSGISIRKTNKQANKFCFPYTSGFLLSLNELRIWISSMFTLSIYLPRT